MSELSGKFLQQLRNDIVEITKVLGEPGQKLRDLSQKIDIDEQNDEYPVSLAPDRGRIVIHAGHPAVKKLMENPQQRRSDLLFFASSMMSLLNREDVSITDDHEREFHSRLLHYALEHGQGSWAGVV